jgi:hypothetical protein
VRHFEVSAAPAGKEGLDMAVRAREAVGLALADGLSV